ncbi:hypothetical protein, partial [Hoylesella marshii]
DMKRCKEFEISLHKIYTLFIYRICYTQLNHGGKGKVNSANSQTFRFLFVIVLPLFDAQKFETLSFQSRKVTDDKSVFVPRTDGIHTWYRWHRL